MNSNAINAATNLKNLPVFPARVGSNARNARAVRYHRSLLRYRSKEGKEVLAVQRAAQPAVVRVLPADSIQYFPN
jgi:hypothetical protein